MSRMMAAVLLLALAGCGSSQQKATKAAARYDADYARRDYWSARIEIRRALAEQDDVPEYWAKLARVQIGLGNYLDAYDAYTRVIELDRNNVEALQTLSELAYAGSAFDDAEKFADRMLDINPRSLRVLLIKGEVALVRHQLPEAQAIADKMLEIDPTYEGAVLLAARVANAHGDRARAIGIIETSIAREGESVAKLTGLLDLYMGYNDFRNGARIYARLFALRPGDVALRLDYAKALYEQGRPDRALEMLARLTRAHPGDTMLQQRIVDIWTEAGGAAVDVDRVRRFVLASGDPQMKVALGHLLIDQKRFADAEAVLRPFIDPLADKGGITAANVEADVLYAGALAGLGRGGAAQALIDRILDFDDSNPRALHMRVRIALAAGDLPGALRDAQTLTTDNPDMTDGRIELAEIYVRRKEKVLADGAYARAMNDLSKDPQMLVAYAGYLVRTGRAAMARDVAKRFTSENPQSLDGWRERARLCIAANDSACIADTFSAFDRIPGGARIRHSLEASRPVAAARAAIAQPGAGQSAPTCGRTGAPC